MNNIPTPHIEAKSKDQVADTVLMPGDPKRAEFIATTFLKDVRCFNTVRGMLGFTGIYNDKVVSVMGSGMGMPSMGIYSYELFKFYGVNHIIRLGSAGAISRSLNLNDIVFAMGACTNISNPTVDDLSGVFAPIADYHLLRSAEKVADTLDCQPVIGNVLSNGAFYQDNLSKILDYDHFGVLAVEMECAALYINAAKLNKKALCIVTISDLVYDTTKFLTAQERQSGFCKMAQIGLTTACTL